MNPAQLLAHFDRISEAPDAIPHLRRFILDLAVRGKLVEQDPNDEPAGELLRRIQEEKARRIKTGEIRSPRSIEWTENIEQLFPIVNSWSWARLADVGAIVGGGTPQSNDADNFTAGGTGIAWLTPADLGKHNELYVSHGSRDITEKGLKSSSATLMPKDSVLFTSRAPIGYTAISANEITTNQGFKSVVPYITECSRYIALYLKAFGPWIDSKASGTTFREVSGKIVSGLPIPVPPLPEQHRIVAKVDELMALCDQLEAAKAERESQRDRLIAASLHRLNSSADANTSCKHARFYLNHLPRLTTRPEHIKQLRQTILNLAVRGRLVPQDPNDEPAEELLKRIEMEKVKLIKEAKKSKEKLLITSQKNDLIFSLIPGWKSVKISQILVEIQTGPFGSSLHQSDYQKDGIPVINPASIKNEKLFPIDGMAVGQTTLERLATFKLRKGDIVLGRRGEMGRCAVVTDNEVGWLCGTGSLVLRLPQCIFPRFIVLLIGSPFVRQYLSGSAVGATMQNLNQSILLNLIVGLPPLAEQHRIVAKVDELMALCDQLEAQLTTTQADSRRLLEAMLHRALGEAHINAYPSTSPTA